MFFEGRQRFSDILADGSTFKKQPNGYIDKDTDLLIKIQFFFLVCAGAKFENRQS